jgi:molecular chaperone Hsp33
MSELHKFIFEGLPVRGAIVRLTDSWQEIQTRRGLHDDGAYPALVQNLLGEMTAAAVLMQSNIKFNGSLILQVMGGERRDESPVKLAVVEVSSSLSFRTTAKVVHEVIGTESLSQLINKGNQARCAITLDPEQKFQGQQPYQSCMVTTVRRWSRLPRCWSTTCCNLSNWIPSWFWRRMRTWL